MAAKELKKVMKYQMVYRSGYGDRQTAIHHLFETSRQVREIMNKTIQRYYKWDGENFDHYEKTGEYLDLKTETKYKTMDGYLYNELKDGYPNIGSRIMSTAVRTACQKYASDRTEMLRGAKSIVSYRADQPIPIPSAGMTLEELEDHTVTASFELFSDKFKKQAGITDSLCFTLSIRDGTQDAIMARILDGTYKLSRCQIEYNRRKHKWMLSVCYAMEKKPNTLDKKKILGVDLGVTYVMYASSLGENTDFSISGDEADEYGRRYSAMEYARKLEEKKKQLQHQAAHCGDGRRGHGTKTRVEKVYQAGDKIANYRKTLNHRYSKDLVAFAVKHGYGTIQMEDLSGVKTDDKRLRHWTYYDLQEKIKYKAEEVGIEVKTVSPAYTSQRCSRCGFIDAGNRKDQSHFYCLKCGLRRNADWNASQNLSVKGIDKIIEKERKKQNT